jgi:hypothetical protein
MGMGGLWGMGCDFLAWAKQQIESESEKFLGSLANGCLHVDKQKMWGRKPYQPPFSGTQPFVLVRFCMRFKPRFSQVKSKPGESLFASTQMQVMQQTS